MGFSVRCSGDVGELENFFDGGKYGCDRVPRMICRLLDYVLSLGEFVGNQLTVVVLEVSDHFRHGVIDVVCCVISDIRKICLLNHGDNLLHEGLLKSLHLAIKMHFLSVCDLYV